MARQFTVPTVVDFWSWLARFAWRRAINRLPEAAKPVGLPYNRDPENPCEFYEPRPRRVNTWADCQSDGHYLCATCCRLQRQEPDVDSPA